MRRSYKYIVVFLAVLFLAQPASAQIFKRLKERIKTERILKRSEKPIDADEAGYGYVMHYTIIGTDTVFVDELPPAMINPKETMSKTDWVKYYKRVHNFSKAYPYALVISGIINSTDRLFEEEHYTRRQKEKYLNDLKDDLLNDFEPLFRKLTLSQGLMMIRLVDRECGMTPYYIVKNYLGGIAASFWQGVAKMFKGNLKQPYDKFGEDKDLEELVGYWQRGDFDWLYITVFGQPKPEVPIPQKYR